MLHFFFFRIDIVGFRFRFFLWADLYLFFHFCKKHNDLELYFAFNKKTTDVELIIST